MGAATLAFLIVSAGQIFASSQLSDEFAACTGRLRAQLEFQWLMSDPASDRTALRSQAMASLLDTMIAPENSARLFAARIEAKHAHSALLHRGVFNEDIEDAAWARQRAEEQISNCTSLLLI